MALVIMVFLQNIGNRSMNDSTLTLPFIYNEHLPFPTLRDQLAQMSWYSNSVGFSYLSLDIIKKIVLENGAKNDRSLIHHLVCQI